MKLYGKYGSAKALGAARGMQALRAPGRGIRGVGRLGWRATRGVAGAVLQSSGFAPVVGAAASLGRGLFSSKRGGRSRGGGGSSESETGLLNTSLLFQIRDEVAQIKGLLVTQQIPESERREREFEDWRRHRELLSAISGLSGVGGGLLTTGKKDGGSLANLLMGLLAITGLAMLPKLLENIPSIIDGIQNFLDKMGLFLLGMWGAFKVLGKRVKGMKPPPKPKTTRPGRKPTRKPGKSFIRRIFAKKTSPTGGPRGKTGRRGWFNTMRARGTSPTGGPRGKTDRRGWFRRMAAGGLGRGPSGRSNAASRPAARANPYRTWEGRPGGDRTRITRATTAATADRTRLGQRIAVNTDLIKSTENRLKTNIGQVRTIANNARATARTNTGRIDVQGRNIRTLETKVQVNEKTATRARMIEARGVDFASHRQGMRAVLPTSPSTAGQGRHGRVARTGGWKPVSPSHSTRTPYEGPGKRRFTPTEKAGTTTPVRPSHSTRAPFVPELEPGFTAEERVWRKGTTYTTKAGTEVVRKGGWMTPTPENLPTIKAAREAKATHMAEQNQIRASRQAARMSIDAGSTRGQRIQPYSFSPDAASTRGQRPVRGRPSVQARIPVSGFEMDAGSMKRPVRGRPSVPATLPKVTGGGPSGRSPGATLYETPWQRFMRAVNKGARNLSSKGKRGLKVFMGGLRPAMAEGGKVMAQFNNMKMVRSLGFFALLIIAIIEFAELVALRMEDRISWPVFWEAALIKMAAIGFLLVMFASFMALIVAILVALAPTLGPVLIGGLAIGGSIYLMNWLAKALGMGAVPGEEWDPQPWLDRATNLRQQGFAMASQNIWDDPMTVLAGAITQVGGVAVEAVTRAFMAPKQLAKIGPAINTMFDVDRNDRFAREKGYADYAAYAKDNQFEKFAHRRERRRSGANTEYRPPKKPKVITKQKDTPEQKVLGNRGLKGSLRKLRRTYKSWQTTAKDPTQRDFAHSNMEMIQAQIWAMLSMGSAEDQIFVIYNSQYVDNSKNSQSLSSVTSVISGQGSNVSVAGQGFYE